MSNHEMLLKLALETMSNHEMLLRLALETMSNHEMLLKSALETQCEGFVCSSSAHQHRKRNWELGARGLSKLTLRTWRKGT